MDKQKFKNLSHSAKIRRDKKVKTTLLESGCVNH